MTTRDQVWMLNLSNGVEVPTRFIQPSDAKALQRFHHRLSERSIYLRFFELVSDLSDERARYFTELDGIQRFAIVALDPENCSEIIAVARIDGEPKNVTGEFAVIVEDQWQGIGLGSALMRLLFDLARRHGFRRVFAYVLSENHQMLALVHDLGFPAHSRFEGGATRIDIDLTVCSDALVSAIAAS